MQTQRNQAQSGCPPLFADRDILLFGGCKTVYRGHCSSLETDYYNFVMSLLSWQDPRFEFRDDKIRDLFWQYDPRQGAIRENIATNRCSATTVMLRIFPTAYNEIGGKEDYKKMMNDNARITFLAGEQWFKEHPGVKLDEDQNESHKKQIESIKNAARFFYSVYLPLSTVIRGYHFYLAQHPILDGMTRMTPHGMRSADHHLCEMYKKKNYRVLCEWVWGNEGQDPPIRWVDYVLKLRNDTLQPADIDSWMNHYKRRFILTELARVVAAPNSAVYSHWKRMSHHMVEGKMEFSKYTAPEMGEDAFKDSSVNQLDKLTNIEEDSLDCILYNFGKEVGRVKIYTLPTEKSVTSLPQLLDILSSPHVSDGSQAMSILKDVIKNGTMDNVTSFHSTLEKLLTPIFQYLVGYESIKSQRDSWFSLHSKVRLKYYLCHGADKIDTTDKDLFPGQDSIHLAKSMMKERVGMGVSEAITAATDAGRSVMERYRNWEPNPCFYTGGDPYQWAYEMGVLVQQELRCLNTKKESDLGKVKTFILVPRYTLSRGNRKTLEEFSEHASRTRTQAERDQSEVYEKLDVSRHTIGRGFFRRAPRVAFENVLRAKIEKVALLNEEHLFLAQKQAGLQYHPSLYHIGLQWSEEAETTWLHNKETMKQYVISPNWSLAVCTKRPGSCTGRGGSLSAPVEFDFNQADMRAAIENGDMPNTVSPYNLLINWRRLVMAVLNYRQITYGTGGANAAIATELLGHGRTVLRSFGLDQTRSSPSDRLGRGRVFFDSTAVADALLDCGGTEAGRRKGKRSYLNF